VNRESCAGALVTERHFLVAKRTRPTVVAVMVSGGHLVPVIYVRGELLDLERVHAGANPACSAPSAAASAN